MAKIGIFDSGVGGLSVWKEVYKLLPGEDYVYFADNANCPYGEKPAKFIEDRACEIVEWMISKGVQIVVVACNTATAAAIDTLRSRFPIRFVGMEPAVKSAAMMTSTGVVGVLATAGTLGGEKYRNLKTRFGADVEIVERVGEGFVELVEAGKVEGAEAEQTVEAVLRPILARGADTVALGCTHYPFLIGTMRKVAGEGVSFIDPAPAIARRLENVMAEEGIGTSARRKDKPSIELYASGDRTTLDKMYRLLGI